jgi:3-deoxy-D-manno-octulosonate 8-phosphate phosphatase KdsC-like HAD superfamily phosphatase
VGGAGALREAAEVILKTQGFWDEILEKYEIGGVEA